ncbi:hypothetical protein Hdeb2414_s0010g00351401 [Helianthus debilis subsp. tardiflorus]
MTCYNFPRDIYSKPLFPAYIYSSFLRYDHSTPRNIQVFFFSFFSVFSLQKFSMASRPRSQTADYVPTFYEQNLLNEPSKEVCSFDNADIAALRTSGAFPAGAVIRPFDREVRSDFYSDEWVCFLAYPFSIGLQYPFAAFISRFFELTCLSYAQSMPMVWRVLVTLDQIKARHVPDQCIEDLPIGDKIFFFVKRDSIDKGVDLPEKWLTSANFKELAPPSAESEGKIKENYQLLESERTFSLLFRSSSQKSSSNMSAPIKNPEFFHLDELDSYSDPVQVKQEVNPKPAVTSKPTSSKTAAVPKPSTASKPRGSTSHKRKEPDSTVASDVFPFKNHGFLESSKFMTGFLNQGLEQLVFLYEDTYGLNKMLETKLKKAETTIADQAAIATAKSQHYEDKYKAMTQEHHAALKKVIQEAQAKFDAAQVQHQQDMTSYRKDLRALLSSLFSKPD